MRIPSLPTLSLALALLSLSCGRINFAATSVDSGTDSDAARSDAAAPRIVSTGEPLIIAGDSNIFGAGHTLAPAPSGSGGGTLPPSIRLPPGVERTLWLTEVTGMVNIAGSPFGPDGSDVGSLFKEGPYGGLSAYWSSRNGALALVFVDDTEPMDPAPPDFESGGLTYLSVSPLPNQIIAIGDGRSESGNLQGVEVPDAATRVFFGVADSSSASALPGAYGDNTGSYTLSGEFHVPPEL